MKPKEFKEMSEKTIDSLNKLKERVNQLHDLSFNYLEEIKIQKNLLYNLEKLKEWVDLCNKYGCNSPEELEQYIKDLEQIADIENRYK